MRKAETARKIGGMISRHALELDQFAVEEGVGELVLAAVGAGAAIGLEQAVERLDDRCSRWRRAAGAG